MTKTTHTGQLGLAIRSKGLLPWAIRLITKSPANHVVIGLGDDTCLGAESPKAVIRPNSHFNNIAWSEFTLTKKQLDGIVAWANQHEGVPYSWWTVIAIGVTKILGDKAPKWLEDYLASDGQYECAQLAQCAYLAVGIDLFEGAYRPGEVYPGSFVPLWQKNGWLPSK